MIFGDIEIGKNITFLPAFIIPPKEEAADFEVKEGLDINNNMSSA